MDNIKESVHNDFVKLRENKSEYFGKFYDNNYKLVYRICFSILKNTENSEDMAQSVFEKLLKMKEDKYPTEFESSWLYTVAKNECLQLVRKTKVNEDEEKLETVKSDSDEIENVIENDNYDKIVKKLDKKQEQIVSLKVVSDFTFKEIGQIMSMPIATVQWYYYTSIKSLKAAMANFAMFLIAFIIGIKYFQKEEKEVASGNDKKNKEINNKTDNKQERASDSQTNNEESDIGSYTNSHRNIDSVINTTETSMEYRSDEKSFDYKGAGIISVCGIFLTLTIIFSIIFIKYQQKGNKKTSKK